MSAATMPTMMEVVVEDDCTSTVDSTPSITPTIGFCGVAANPWHNAITKDQKVDLGFVCFCTILLGQVGNRQNGQVTLAAMVETTKPQSTKNSL